MQEIALTLDESTVEQLDVELDLLGFDTRSAYLRWLIDNRASIDQGTEHDRLLHAYADQLDALEERLDALEAMSTDPDPADPPTPGPPADSGAADEETEDAPTLQIRGSPDATRTISGTSADESANASGPDTGSETAATATQSSEGPPAPASAAGAAGTVSHATDRPEPTTETSDSAKEAGVTSMNLAPERVNRIAEDPISKNADVLSGVETDRLDELTRRAVAKTREQLDRTVETGLSYRSSTSLADEDVRAGDDITSLDDLELPGRSEETVRPRQIAAGHALAFLRDVGEARRADFVDALYEEFPAGYDTESGWWNCIKQALKQVEAVDGGHGARVWQFIE
jgi:hypothetical protein